VSPDPRLTPTEDEDELYLHLKGVRERLCLAERLVPAHWTSDLQVAIGIVDSAGSALCPKQWSKHDQPEYRKVR